MKAKKMTKLNIFIETDFNDNTTKSLEFDNFDLKKILINTKKIMKFILNQEQIIKSSCLYKEKYNILTFDIVFCNDDKIKEINKEYRNIDKTTDVITFALFADTNENERFIFDNEINLGEIIISFDTMIHNAHNEPHFEDKFENPIMSELYFLISHGILHLLGYDHKDEKSYKKMMDYQNNIIENLLFSK